MVSKIFRAGSTTLRNKKNFQIFFSNSLLPGLIVQSYGRPGTIGGAVCPMPKPAGFDCVVGIVFEPPKDKSRFKDDSDEVP